MVDGGRLSLGAYGKLHGKSKQAAAKWKASGRLVMVDDLVDVAKSDRNLQHANLGRFAVDRTEGRPRAASAVRLPAPRKIGIRPNETAEQAAERTVFQDGRIFESEAAAKRHKESFLALQREVDYDRDIGSVVPIEDVVAAVAGEYALVRNRLLNIATRIAPRAAMLRSAEEVRALIDNEVALALKELTLDAGGDVDPADAREAVRSRFKKSH